MMYRIMRWCDGDGGDGSDDGGDGGGDGDNRCLPLIRCLCLNKACIIVIVKEDRPFFFVFFFSFFTLNFQVFS